MLVADDYPAVLAWATRTFQRAGWTVLSATDGDAALRCWTEARAVGAPIAALVTDLDLPGLDGTGLAQRLRVEDPDLPVLAMHAGDGELARWEGPLPERTVFFQKPVRASQLVATTQALVQARIDAAARVDADDASPLKPELHPHRVP